MGDIEEHYRRQKLEEKEQRAREREIITLEVIDLIPKVLAHVQEHPPTFCEWVNDGATVHVGWRLSSLQGDGEDPYPILLLSNGQIALAWPNGVGSLDHPHTAKEWLTDKIRALGEEGLLLGVHRGLKRLMPDKTQKPRRKWFRKG